MPQNLGHLKQVTYSFSTYFICEKKKNNSNYFIGLFRDYMNTVYANVYTMQCAKKNYYLLMQ